MIQLIPAIDVLDGRCVRLHQGRYDRETVYERNPAVMARAWQRQHATWLHVVDLDAARGGSRSRAHNRAEIAAICRAVEIPVQVGGGIRTLDDIDAVLRLGASRVILGTSAALKPSMISDAVQRFSPAQIVVGIDAKGGEVRVQGWTEGSGLDATAMALDMERRGVRRIVYTDIARDGTMKGPNLAAYRALGSHLGAAQITASGGVGSFRDLTALDALQPYRVDSVIVGRALYEMRFPCQKVWQAHADDSAAGP